MVSGKIEVTQILEIVHNSYSGLKDVVAIKYIVKNVDTVSHDVGIRVMLDTMLARNDGAPFKVPGIGNVTREMEFIGNDVPVYWQAFDNLTNPTVQSQGTLISGGLPPDRFVIARWPGIAATSWNYSVSPGASITGDSAVGIYWNPSLLRSGESRTYITHYGIGGVGVDTDGPLAVGVAAPEELLRQNMGPNFVPNDSLYPNPFTINAYLENLSSQVSGAVTGITAKIILPDGLELTNGNLQQINVGTLNRGQSTQVSWNIRTAETDTHKLEGDLPYTIEITTDQGNKEIYKTLYIPHWFTARIEVFTGLYTVASKNKIIIITPLPNLGYYEVGDKIKFSAVPEGNHPDEEILYEWDFDGDGQWGDKTGKDVVESFLLPKSYAVGLKATNKTTGAIAIRRIYIPIISPALLEPQVASAVDIIPGVGLEDYSGRSFVFDSQKKEKGLIIITHGLTSSGTAEWLSEMKGEIEDRLNSSPNICLYDWKEMADPCNIPGTSCVIDFLEQCYLVRVYGLAEGLILADWIRAQIVAGNIDPSAKIHIIGHSAGGFVAESCASALGNTITQITMLDTPLPVLEKGLDFLKDGGKIDAYISRYGHLCDPKHILSFSFLDIDHIPDAWKKKHPSQVHWTPIGGSHSYAYEWYTNTCKADPLIKDGFYYSPWLGNSFSAKSSLSVKSSETDKQSILKSTQNIGIETFEVFGNVEEVNGVYTISEGTTNSGIFKTIDFPSNVQDVAFRYKFLTEGDGDFLSVHLKDDTDSDTLLYIGPNLSITREDYIDGYADVSAMAGKKGQLIFKLVKRGEQNTILSIDSIEMQVLEEEVPPVLPPNGGDGGTAPVGPLAVGLSGLLSWMKRRQKKF